jgi:SAM-dependent methyltransferase
MRAHKPKIVDTAAHEQFVGAARAIRVEPEDLWIGGYVDYVWMKTAPLLEGYVSDFRQTRALEFGCNIGATAIVLTHLGATVDAVDISDKWLALAQLNARRYQARAIRFRRIDACAALPFSSATFDMISCASVLEYVTPGLFPGALSELDRVLKPGGLFFSFGTSNRLWPREVHSRRWFSNYLPRTADRILGYHQRGVFPWEIRPSGYRDLVFADPRKYLRLRASSTAPGKLALLKAGAHLAHFFGCSIGDLTPSMLMVMQKPE